MVKIVFTGPRDFHLRENRSSKVYSFTRENNRTLDVEWDVVYKAIRLSEYIKIDGDPKAIVKGGYKAPGVKLLGELGPTNEPKTVIENEDGESSVVNTNEMVDEVVDGIDDFEEVEALVSGEHEEPIDESVNEEKKTIVAEVWSQVTGESVLS